MSYHAVLDYRTPSVATPEQTSLPTSIPAHTASLLVSTPHCCYGNSTLRMAYMYRIISNIGAAKK